MSEFLISKREQIAWTTETVFGDGGTMASGEIVGYNALVESPDFDLMYQEILNNGSDSYKVSSHVSAGKSFPFVLSFVPVNWRWLKYLMTVVDAGGPAYTHTFSLGSTVSSFALEWARRHTTPHVVNAVGCYVISARVVFQKATGAGTDGLMRVVLTCMAKDASFGSTVTELSQLTATPYMFKHTKFTYNNGEFVEVNNDEINIARGINPNDSRYCNTTADGTVSTPIPTITRVGGNINVNTEDSTFDDAWLASSPILNTKIEFIRGASDQLVFPIGGFRLHKTLAATNADGGVVASTLVWTDEGNASTPVATDTTATY